MLLSPALKSDKTLGIMRGGVPAARLYKALIEFVDVGP